jgi:hypothetical protein
MASIDENPGVAGDGEGKKDADQADADGQDAADERAADSAFDDLNIEVDESEVEAELRSQPSRKS